MMNVGISFDLLQQVERAPPGWTKASGHIIFDIKMDFTRKSRWVKDGHETPYLTTSAYAGVVSKESVRIAITYAALMGLDVMAADVQTHTYKHRLWKITMLFVAWNLDWKILASLLSSNALFMVARYLEEIIGTT